MKSREEIARDLIYVYHKDDALTHRGKNSFKEYVKNSLKYSLKYNASWVSIADWHISKIKKAREHAYQFGVDEGIKRAANQMKGKINKIVAGVCKEWENNDNELDKIYLNDIKKAKREVAKSILEVDSPKDEWDLLGYCMIVQKKLKEIIKENSEEEYHPSWSNG